MGKAIDNEPSLTRLVPASRFGLGRFWRHTTEGETGYSASPYEALRDALARENILHRRMQSAMQEYEILRQESDHRLSNNLQMVVSLLMKQSRSATPESAPQLAAAAQRVMAIERTHRHLHSNDGSETVAFRIYLETLCADISGIINTEDGPGRDILSPVTISVFQRRYPLRWVSSSVNSSPTPSSTAMGVSVSGCIADRTPPAR